MRKSIPMFDFKIGADSVRRTPRGCMGTPRKKNAFYRLAPPSRRSGNRGLLSFLRHGEIYRSDMGLKSIPQLACRRVLPPIDRALETEVNGCGFDAAPFPSSAMSLGLDIPWQVALQQSLPPLFQPEPLCNDKKWSVEQFSAESTCLTNGVSQNSPQSRRRIWPRMHTDAHG